MGFLTRWRVFSKFDFNPEAFQTPVEGTAFTRRLFKVVHGHNPNDKLTQYLDRTLAATILVSATLDTFLDVNNSSKLFLPLVITLDWLTTIILTIEILLKCLTANLDTRLAGMRSKRFRFLLRPMSLFDLVIVVVSWFSIFFPLHLFLVQYLRIIRLTELVHPLMAAANAFMKETQGYTTRRRLFIALMCEERKSGIPKTIDFTLFSVILFSIFLMTLESVDWIKIAYKPRFHQLDMIVTAVFILDYLGRVYCCAENPVFRKPILGRVRYMLTGGAIIDLVSIAPYFLGFVWITPVPWLWSLRLLRMLKLARYSTAVSTIFAVVREERAVLSAATGMLFLLTVFAASCIYVAEHTAQPEKFSSIPASMYWAVITLTSIGYGDYYPITPMGKFLTSILAVVGLGMIALPAGILANGFSQKIKEVKSPHPFDLTNLFDQSEKLSTGGLTQSPNPELSHESNLADPTPNADRVASEKTFEKLNGIIKMLDQKEREVLIALLVISLRQPVVDLRD